MMSVLISMLRDAPMSTAGHGGKGSTHIIYSILCTFSFEMVAEDIFSSSQKRKIRAHEKEMVCEL
jgi:hypothetical protein